MRPFPLEEREIRLITELRHLPVCETEAIQTTVHELYEAHAYPKPGVLGNIVPIRSVK